MLQNAVERVQNRFGMALSSATDWALAAAILIGAAVIAVVAACRPALVGAPIHGRAPSLPAHCPCRDQRADAAWPAAYSARHRVADVAARKRDGRHSRPTARPGDHLPARLGRADGTAYRRRSLSQAFSAQPHGQPAGAQARDAGPRI